MGGGERSSRRAEAGEYQRRARSMTGCREDATRLLLAFDGDTPARIMLVEDASELADRSLVGQTRDLAGLEAHPQAPEEFSFRVGELLTVGRRVPDVHQPHREVEVVEVLPQAVPDAG